MDAIVVRDIIMLVGMGLVVGTLGVCALLITKELEWLPVEPVPPTLPPDESIPAVISPIEQYVLNYRKKLCVDLRAQRLLAMNWELDRVYVPHRLRFYQNNTRTRFAQLQQEANCDPNLRLLLNRRNLDSRADELIQLTTALQQFSRCLIIGDSGVGKTTLLQHLALQSAAGELVGLPDLPIYIDLHAFMQRVDKQSGLLEFAATTWERDYQFPYNEAITYMQKHLKNGSAILLLDSLHETTLEVSDETSNDAPIHIATIIRQLTLTYPRAFMVVTTHSASCQQQSLLTPCFVELELLNWNAQEQAQFVENWGKMREQPELAGALNDELRHVHALSAKPLSLVLTAFFYEKRQVVTTRVIDLYAQSIELTMQEMEADQTGTQLREIGFSPEAVLPLTRHIAWHFHCQGQRIFHKDELLTVIATYLQVMQMTCNAEVLLSRIVAWGGLLQTRGDDLYALSHMALQTYFAALAAQVMQEEGANELLKHTGEIWWEDVILLYTDLLDDASQFLQRLIEEPGEVALQEQLFCTRLVLAVRCLAVRGVRSEEAPLRDLVIERAFKTLGSTPYTLVSDQVTAALVALDDTSINERLLGMVSEKKLPIPINVRQSAIRALCQAETKEVDSLCELLPDEQLDQDIRITIVETLGERGLSSSGSTLLALIKNSMIASAVRTASINALMHMLDEQIISALIELLLNKRLGHSVVDRLNVREAILDAFIATNATNMGATPGFTDCLWQLYREESSALQWRSAVILAMLGEPSVLPYLLACLQENSLLERRSSEVATALVVIRQPELHALLVENLWPLLADEKIDRSVRVSMITVLFTSKNFSLLAESLSALVKNQEVNECVRVAAAYVFSSLGEREDAILLSPLEVQDELNVYRSVMIARVRLGVFSGVSTILSWLPNEQEELEYQKELEVSECIIILEALHMLTYDEVKKYAVVPRLLAVLANDTLHIEVRRSIINLLVLLANDAVLVQEIMNALETLLSEATPIRDDAHRALWMLARL